MQTAKIFTTGRSQAVRLPKAFQFNEKEVIIQHFGNGVLLLPPNTGWQSMQEAIHEFEPNFMIDRDALPEQIRDEII